METKYNLNDFSSLSVVCSVDKFIKSVESMNETVMVPSRLLDVDPPESETKVPILLRGNSDPYTFYSILNNVKTSLVWGVSENDELEIPDKDDNDESSIWFVQTDNGQIVSEIKKDTTKGHARKASSVSTASVSSTSEVECERLSETGDSGVDPEEAKSAVEQEELDSMSNVTSALKLHLVGLRHCLNRLTETATYITEKYQEEVIV